MYKRQVQPREGILSLQGGGYVRPAVLRGTVGLRKGFRGLESLAGDCQLQPDQQGVGVLQAAAVPLQGLPGPRPVAAAVQQSQIEEGAVAVSRADKPLGGLGRQG